MTTKPVIGITCGGSGDYSLRRQYCDAVARCGGVPVILPPADECEPQLSHIDGLILSGGGDIAPERFGVYDYDASLVGEPDIERDAYELALARRAYEYDLPTLGICRGIQTIAVALGGSLHLDIPNHKQSQPRPEPSHEIAIVPDSLICALAGATRDRVNSFHHQAVEYAPDGFDVAAYSQDGFIEAIEARGRRFYVGVQWHPEHMRCRLADGLFASLTAACEK